jgi:SAM-dependent methyltransferase
LYLAQPPAGAADSEAIVLSLGKNRFRRILSHSFIVGEGIEVGALQNPLPVSEATTVRYVDRLSREDLYLHYPELRQYNLVDPDILDNGEELATVSDCSQDFIIANHFLEHCEDTLKALRNFARALRPGGRIFLALPDKRFTFDKNRAVTQLSHILRDYEQGADSSRSEHFREWASLVEPFFGRCYQSGEETQARAEQLMKEEYSIHFHCWTPREVHELLEHAITVLRFPLEVEYFLSTEEEMIIILRRTETERGGVLEPKEMLAPLNDSHPAGVGFRGSPASNSASAETLGAASPDAVVTRSQPSLPHQ